MSPFWAWVFGFICGALFIVIMLIHWWFTEGRQEFRETIREGLEKGFDEAQMESERQRFQIPKP